MNRIVVADDHAMFREGLVNLLRLSNMDVIAECSNGREALEAIIAYTPDVALLDISMPEPDGITIVEQAMRLSKNVKFLLLTAHDSPETCMRAFKTGVSGYLSKECAFKELICAIETVQNGRKYISPAITAKYPVDTNPPKVHLTSRENEILRHVGLGMPSRQIAEKLFISIKTVDVHRTNIMKKLDIHSTAALVRYALTYSHF